MEPQMSKKDKMDLFALYTPAQLGTVLNETLESHRRSIKGP